MVGSSSVGRALDDVTTTLLSICAAIDVITERMREKILTITTVHLIIMIVVLINTSSSKFKP